MFCYSSCSFFKADIILLTSFTLRCNSRAISSGFQSLFSNFCTISLAVSGGKKSSFSFLDFFSFPLLLLLFLNKDLRRKKRQIAPITDMTRYLYLFQMILFDLGVNSLSPSSRGRAIVSEDESCKLSARES
jgi:hypothetical protein